MWGCIIGGEVCVFYSFEWVLDCFNFIVDFLVGIGGVIFVGVGFY